MTPASPHDRPFNAGNVAQGLIAWLEETRIALPLKSVDVSFTVSGDLAEVSLDQVFHQTAHQPLDVTYTFPLPGDAAVFRCELIVNDRVIQARVEEQAKAKQIAREMKKAGRRVGLVEVERDNLFTLSLGNVQPDDLIVVRFAWFQALDHLQSTKSLSIPFTPGIRYIPGKPLLRSNRGKGSVDDTDEVPDASRITPPRIDAFHSDAALISLNGKLDARFVDMSSVTSATHPVIVRDELESLQVTIPPSGNVPDRDFVLRWNESATDTLDPKVISSVDKEFQYAVVRLDAPTNAPVIDQASRDYYFLVDRSGSMKGPKWACTARALKAFVGEIDEKDRVWVTLFETSFQDFAEAPLSVTELKNDPAFQALEKVGVAGGTNLLPALEHAIQRIAVHSREHPPIVIIITDGQVGNDAGVLKVLRNHRNLTIHTFGIDSAVNDAFLKQVAAQHRGACVLMTPNDDIEGAVRQLGSRLRRPVFTGLAIPEGWEATCDHLSDIHAGEHILVALKGPRQAASIELTGTSSDQKIRVYRFDLHPELLASPRLLWARQAIERCLAEGNDQEAIQLAIRHNIICRGAAFIAYDTKEKVTIAKEEIYQPSMNLTSFGGDVVRYAAAAPAPANLRSRTATMYHPSSADYRKTNASSPKPHDAEKEKRIQEISNRHFSTSIQITVRTELLAVAWQEKTFGLRSFKTITGNLLLKLLHRWALSDPVTRFPLLTRLADDLSGSDYCQRIQAFVKDNIAEPQMASDLLWLTDHLG